MVTRGDLTGALGFRVPAGAVYHAEMVKALEDSDGGGDGGVALAALRDAARVGEGTKAAAAEARIAASEQLE